MSFDAAEIRKVRLMKEAGFNLLRTSHNPQSAAFYAACDSLGMMVIDEAFDGWYTQKTPYDYHLLIDSCYQEDISAMVLRDRNHPSIVCWSIGNEVIERKELRVVQTAKNLKNTILKYDKTRPVTEALCSWDNDWEKRSGDRSLSCGAMNQCISPSKGTGESRTVSCLFLQLPNILFAESRSLLNVGNAKTH